ncbi:hypothetical protein [Maricaulis sp. CAU 1757]
MSQDKGKNRETETKKDRQTGNKKPQHQQQGGINKQPGGTQNPSQPGKKPGKDNQQR